MASTFGGGLLSISQRSIWIDFFTKWEELIGKAQFRLGENIISQNLQEEILLSPMNTSLNWANVTLMMDPERHTIVPPDNRSLLVQEQIKYATLCTF
jgi:hypothetical protein